MVDANDDVNIEPIERADESFFGHRLSLTDRIWLVFVGVAFGALAWWMFWIVQTTLVGREWGDIAVRVFLHELILGVAFLGCGAILHAIFSPRWLDRFLVRLSRKLYATTTVIAYAFAALVFLGLLLVVVDFARDLLP